MDGGERREEAGDVDPVLYQNVPDRPLAAPLRKNLVERVVVLDRPLPEQLLRLRVVHGWKWQREMPNCYRSNFMLCAQKDKEIRRKMKVTSKELTVYNWKYSSTYEVETQARELF